MGNNITIYANDNPSDIADNIQDICVTKEKLLEVFKSLAARLDIAYYECMVENSRICSRESGLLDKENKYTCIGCEYENVESHNIPCCDCLRQCKDYYKPKKRGNGNNGRKRV